MCRSTASGIVTASAAAPCLARELGLVRGIRAWFHGLPDELRAKIDPDALGVEEQNAPSDGLQFAMLFVTEAARLERQLAAVRPLLQSKAAVLVAWPSAGSGNVSDLDAARVRDVTHGHALVENKCLDLDESWHCIRFQVGRP